MSLLLFLSIRFVAYGAVEGLGGLFFRPLQVFGVLASTEVANGDGLLYQGRWLRTKEFERGDLVVFEIEGRRYGQLIGLGYGYGYILGDGLAIDRIIGVPGDVVEIAGGMLSVNGKSPEANVRPLLGMRNYGTLRVALGPEEYAILPSTLQLAIHGQVPIGPIFERLVRVPRDAVLGRVVFRLHPLARIGTVE
jgi:hypothetical protein